MNIINRRYMFPISLNIIHFNSLYRDIKKKKDMQILWISIINIALKRIFILTLSKEFTFLEGKNEMWYWCGYKKFLRFQLAKNTKLETSPKLGGTKKINGDW